MNDIRVGETGYWGVNDTSGEYVRAGDVGVGDIRMGAAEPDGARRRATERTVRRVTAIQGKIIIPRYVTERYDIRERLEAVSAPSLLSSFVSWRANEIRGLVDRWSDVPGILRQLRHACRPARLRVGLGIGPLSEDEMKRNLWAIRGMPFIGARAAFWATATEKGATTLVRSDWPLVDDVASCIWALVDTIQEQWTEKQWEAVSAYERTGGYVEAAELLRVKFQNVHKRCKAARWYQVRQAERLLVEMYDSPDGLSRWMKDDTLIFGR